MRRRIVSLLLVPLVLANHALCLAHSHVGTGVAETDVHTDRPHFHCSHAHHGHRHAHREHVPGNTHGPHSAHTERAAIDFPPTITALPDHDAGTLYCANASTLAVPRDLSQVIATCVPSAAILGANETGDNCSPRARPLRAEAHLETGCPIYLRTLSLRI